MIVSNEIDKITLFIDSSFLQDTDPFSCLIVRWNSSDNVLSWSPLEQPLNYFLKMKIRMYLSVVCIIASLVPCSSSWIKSGEDQSKYSFLLFFQRRFWMHKQSSNIWAWRMKKGATSFGSRTSSDWKLPKPAMMRAIRKRRKEL